MGDIQMRESEALVAQAFMFSGFTDIAIFEKKDQIQ